MMCRAHAIFTITVEQKEHQSSKIGVRSTITLVELAGWYRIFVMCFVQKSRKDKLEFNENWWQHFYCITVCMCMHIDMCKYVCTKCILEWQYILMYNHWHTCRHPLEKACFLIQTCTDIVFVCNRKPVGFFLTMLLDVRKAKHLCIILLCLHRLWNIGKH